MKNKNKPLYLLNSDIEQLNERYKALYKQVKNAFENNDFNKNQIEYSCEVLLDKYKFEIEELNAIREKEYLTRQAEIKARNAEQIPWRRCWLWRLIFQPLTNRAQDIIEERAALEAEKLFTDTEKELEAQAKTIYGDNVKTLSKRKRKKVLKKYLKLKQLLNKPDDVSDVEQSEPPARKPRKTKTTEG